MEIQEAIDALPDTTEGIVEFMILNGYTGEPENPYQCPLANYLQMTTGYRLAVTGSAAYDENETAFRCPDAVANFVYAFDRGDYPELSVYVD